MRGGHFIVAVAAGLAASGIDANAEDFGWADGLGLRPCSELELVSDEALVAWTQGYWSGANLYLGSSDLCSERANISALGEGDIRGLISAHCRYVPDSFIMMAAFNALKNLPPLPGSRAASCSGDFEQ